ncbi:MAG: hypothetical protein COS08_08145 [Euryarchaeota archaeon CG01_land_8_20_14_3_00_38_12]|nr:MAG: hypothetical protein COS08_08145 [Euryarchaeota archaeon CG01_land_8_20_14_3_00_38_12]
MLYYSILMNNMKNPFVYGSIVTKEHFVGREKEIKEITAGLLGGQHIILYSPRKFGKSSLVEETFRRINNSRKAIAFRINLQGVETGEALASVLIDETIKRTYSSVEKLSKELKGLFKKINVRVFVDKEGKMGIEPVFKETKDALEDALNFPERVAGKKNKRIIVCFDEFQEIEKFNGLRIEKLFRAITEAHKNVSYMFTGSEKHTISLMFESKDRPFYRFARFLELKTMPDNCLKNFMIKKFNATNKYITDEAVEMVIKFSEGIPFYVQCICHEAWYLTEKKITKETIKQALDEKILSSLTPGFEMVWNKIRSEMQRRLLLAMAVEDKAGYSISFIEKYKLKSSGHVKKSLGALEKSGLVYNMRIDDFFFREWIKKYRTYHGY